MTNINRVSIKQTNGKEKLKSVLKYVIVLFGISSSHSFAEEYEAGLLWSKRVELSTPVSGVVQKVFAQAGKIAAKGETLIQLDPRAFKADLKWAKARVKNAVEQSQEAKRELDRQTDMYDRTMLSEHDLQVAKNNFTAAKALLKQAESELTLARVNLEYSAIRAPFNAVVINIKAVKGQVVASSVMPPVLIIVAEAHRMQARAFISSDNVNNLVPNQGAKVNVAGKTYHGKISNIALEPEPSKPGFYAVDILFDTENKILRSGQKAKVEL